MKEYWDKTAIIGLVGFMISLMLILCFMDSLSHPLVGIFLCLFGILLCGIYGALQKAGSPERQKIIKEKENKKEYENENEISSLYAFCMLCLPSSQHPQPYLWSHPCLYRLRRSQLYMCSHLWGIIHSLPSRFVVENHQHCLQSRLERLGVVIKY